jgi:glycosyltransferase involved in cell wall biosynthesis/SAM-dependent methyltransferase
MNLTEILKNQELSRIQYWKQIDYFLDIRLKWRAQMARHLFHLLPGESILELGCAEAQWSRQISTATKNKNPICAATFDEDSHNAILKNDKPDNIEPILLRSFPDDLKGRKFDYIIGWHLLKSENAGIILSQVKKFLKPGGQFLFFEPNPWNPYRLLRQIFSKIFFLKKNSSFQSSLPTYNRIELFTVLSEIGFVKLKILPYDFLFPPLPKALVWPMQNLSLIFENTPYLRNFAGELFIWGQNPAPHEWEKPFVSLTEHEKLNNKVSVVVPCYNEEPNIPSLIKNLKGFFDDYIYEFIIVDDNSTDATGEIAEKLAEEDTRIKVIRREMPNGVGLAIRDGISAATGEYILTMDSDFQHILPELTGLFDAAAEGADVAVGSRFSRESVLLNYYFTKIIVNRGFHILANLLMGKHFRDVTNNLKLMKREVADKLELTSRDFAVNAETGLQPLLMDAKVKEIPISWINRSVDMGESSFVIFKTGPNYFFVLFRLLFKHWFGTKGNKRSKTINSSNHPADNTEK